MTEGTVIGIDEAGRGPWAGPLTAAAVALDANLFIAGVADSKKLSPRNRAVASRAICKQALSVGIGWAGPGLVDRLGLTKATAIAMEQAYLQLNAASERVVIDGSINFLKHIEGTEAIVKADQSVPAVSAASIVAKHFRDLYMAQQSKLFPVYGFDAHVGYGTAAHKQAMEEYGICKLHRLSFAPVKTLAKEALA